MTADLFASRYALQNRRGQGSFGVVYLALDTRLRERKVALKVLHPQLTIDPDTLRLFENEAGVLAGLRHDHIVTVYDVGVWQDQRYLVMEWIEGPSLAEIVHEQGAQPPDLVADWLRQAAGALGYAHGQGVIHRDIKSANLLLETGRGRLYVTDFGLAQAVQASGGSSAGQSRQALTGTAAYRAPEVGKTGHTPASDLYSLGVVAYELLAGRRPFVAEDPLDLMLLHAMEAPRPLPASIPDFLAAAVARLLAKQPAERFASDAELVAALAPRPIPTPPPAVPPPPTRVAASVAFDWVHVPAGVVLIGSTEDEVHRVIEAARGRSYVGTFSEAWFTCELPQHTVTLSAFRIARVPVTVAQFATFVAATGYRTTAEEKGTAWGYGPDGKWGEITGADWRHPRGPGSDVANKQDHPVTCVSWHDAMAFCRWADVRLPTEAEWERAARGNDGQTYPWGNAAPDDQHCNYFRGKVGDTTPVGSYPKGASPCGALDMAGNVREWTSTRWGGYDWDRPTYRYPYNAADGREALDVEDSRVLRGGGFFYDEDGVRCAFRGWNFPISRDYLVGFRVMSPGF